MQWHSKTIDQISGRELLDILRLREQVFTIGQQCSEPDIDQIDYQATHFFAYHAEKLIAYLRIYDKNNAKNMGRIVVEPTQQGKGYGRKLIQQAIQYLQQINPNCPTQLSAQAHLCNYYQTLGFTPVGEIYEEAGIPHIFMVYAATTSAHQDKRETTSEPDK